MTLLNIADVVRGENKGKSINVSNLRQRWYQIELEGETLERGLTKGKECCVRRWLKGRVEGREERWPTQFKWVPEVWYKKNINW